MHEAPAPVPAPLPSGPPVLRVVRSDDDVRGPAGTAADAATGAGSTPASDGEGGQALRGDGGTGRLRRAAGQRASVPDWADVLLGTAPARLPERDEEPETT